MPIHSETDVHSDRFQFNLKTLLIVVTAASVVFGVLAVLIPKDLPTEYRVTLYLTYALVTAFAIWQIHRSRRRPWKTPVDFVTVKVDAKWQRRVKTPMLMLPMVALTGVSTTFAPLYLLWCGQYDEFRLFEWVTVPLCFLIIYLVPGFYMRLASEVIAELYRSETAPGAPQDTTSSTLAGPA